LMSDPQASNAEKDRDFGRGQVRWDRSPDDVAERIDRHEFGHGRMQVLAEGLGRR
jgi:hypothetical protein